MDAPGLIERAGAKVSNIRIAVGVQRACAQCVSAERAGCAPKGQKPVCRQGDGANVVRTPALDEDPIASTADGFIPEHGEAPSVQGIRSHTGWVEADVQSVRARYRTNRVRSAGLKKPSESRQGNKLVATDVQRASAQAV